MFTFCYIYYQGLYISRPVYLLWLLLLFLVVLPPVPFPAPGSTSLKLTFSGIPGVDHTVISPPGCSEKYGSPATSGVTGTGVCMFIICPEGVGSAGKAGISGIAGIGTSATRGVCSSCKNRCGNGGKSGKNGNGISGKLAIIPNMVGWSGELIAGGVVERGGRSGTVTPGPLNSVTEGISARANTMGGVTVAGFPVVFPLVRLPGGSGGGTFQSDALCRCASALLNGPATARNAINTTHKPLWVNSCLVLYVVRDLCI